MAPERIGSHYLLREQIGKGGMGEVWRAEDIETGGWRAIKVLRPEYARDPAAVTRFVRERNALVALQHPNVVTLHGMIVEGERLALVMDLITEGDLGQFRRDHGGTLPPSLAAELTGQVCDGLVAAHAAGIVHRDLKPGNVLMDRGRPRLTDFGIARIGGEASDTTVGRVMGTVCYMAPEALAGAEPAPACDVYAVGVTLYELLAGRPPFTGQAAMVIHDHLHAAPQRPDGLPDPLWQLIAACLSKDPAGRPTVTQLAAALRHPGIAAAGPVAQPEGPRAPEGTTAAVAGAGPHTTTGSGWLNTITGIGWLSPAGPVPPGPVPPGPLPPAVAGEPARRNASRKRWRTWGIAAAVLVVAGAGAGVAAVYGSRTAGTPSANPVTASTATGQTSLASEGRSPGPAPSQRVSKVASRSGSHPDSPVPSAPAPASPAGRAGPGTQPAGAASPTATSAPATSPAAPATSPAAPSTLSGVTVSNLRVDQIFPASNGNNGAVQISWNQVPGATSYRVYMLVRGSFSTDRTLANEGDLSPGSHEVMVTPEPGGKGLSVSFTIPKKSG